MPGAVPDENKEGKCKTHTHTQASADARLNETAATAGSAAASGRVECQRGGGISGRAPMPPTRNSEERRSRWHSPASCSAVRLYPSYDWQRAHARVQQTVGFFRRALIPPRSIADIRTHEPSDCRATVLTSLRELTRRTGQGKDTQGVAFLSVSGTIRTGRQFRYRGSWRDAACRRPSCCARNGNLTRALLLREVGVESIRARSVSPRRGSRGEEEGTGSARSASQARRLPPRIRAPFSRYSSIPAARISSCVISR